MHIHKCMMIQVTHNLDCKVEMLCVILHFSLPLEHKKTQAAVVFFLQKILKRLQMHID